MSTGNQNSIMIKHEPIGISAVLFRDRCLSGLWIKTQDQSRRDVRKVDGTIGSQCRAFRKFITVRNLLRNNVFRYELGIDG